jgi:hypothetical protein
MFQEGFDPTIPVFEPAKTVHALDRAVTVIGMWLLYRVIHLFYETLQRSDSLAIGFIL